MMHMEKKMIHETIVKFLLGVEVVEFDGGTRPSWFITYSAEGGGFSRQSFKLSTRGDKPLYPEGIGMWIDGYLSRMGLSGYVDPEHFVSVAYQRFIKHDNMFVSSEPIFMKIFLGES